MSNSETMNRKLYFQQNSLNIFIITIYVNDLALQLKDTVVRMDKSTNKSIYMTFTRDKLKT